MSNLPPFTRTERLTPEQKALLHRRDGMILSRKRVMHDLETSRSPLYRRNLEAGLDYLDQQIEALERSLVSLAEAPSAVPGASRHDAARARVPIRRAKTRAR